MKVLALTLTLLVACYDPGVPVYDYTCYLDFHCFDKDGRRKWWYSTEFPILDTIAEVEEFSNIWSRTCGLLAIDYLESYECEFTICASECVVFDD